MANMEEGKLKRELGPVEIFCIASGAMISSGLFVLPGIAFAKAGPAIILAYVLAGLLMIPTMLAKAELATAMPKAGGSYFYLERSLGPLAGTLGGLANWFSIALKSAFALIGIGAFLRLFHPSAPTIQIKLVAVSFCLLFTLINLAGTKSAGRLQIYLVFGLIGALLLYILVGLRSIDPHKYIPFIPKGTRSVISVAGLIFISYGGLTKVVSMAEEIRDPNRTIPLGMFLAFITINILYGFTVFVTVGLLDAATLSGSLVPISLSAKKIMGNAGELILSLAAMTAYITTANAGIMTASRSLFAMSRDKLLPPLLQHVSARFSTPYISILATSAFMIFVILFLTIEDLVKTASTMMLLMFLFVNIAVIVMRESKIQAYRPTFKVPLYPWLQIFAIITYSFLIFEMGNIPLIITGIFAVLGFGWYWFYGRTRITRRPALLHLVERITAKELTTPTLEDELRQILIERDEIIEDRFDQIIKEAEILDLEGPLHYGEAFMIIAKKLSLHLNMDAEVIYNLMLAREAQSTTVVNPGLAIPHIIIDGSGKFDILPVRCKQGVHFPSSPEPVHTMFVLMGTLDERNFHLRALMAIAQIVQDPEFESRWMNARNIEDLRNIILLARRTRSTP